MAQNKTAASKVSSIASHAAKKSASDRKAGAQPAVPPPGGLFGGHRKRTIKTCSFIGSVVSLAVEVPTIYRIWRKHDIDSGFREELMLAVSKMNDCKYCAWGHHEWAHAAGISEDELANIEHGDPEGIERAKWVAISYVTALVSSEYKDVPVELRQEMQANYTTHEIKEIELVARIMDVGNRAANTWDAMLSRFSGNPARGSHVIDELVLSGVFWIVAPITLLILSQKSESTFIELLRGLLDYVQHSEEQEQKLAG